MSGGGTRSEWSLASRLSATRLMAMRCEDLSENSTPTSSRDQHIPGRMPCPWWRKTCCEWTELEVIFGLDVIVMLEKIESEKARGRAT